MSKWYIQVTYSCDCDLGYGIGCGKKSRFILKHNCSVDSTTIYFKPHIEDEESRYGYYYMSSYLSDPQVSALGRLFNHHDPYSELNEPIDPRFWEDVKKYDL